MTAHATNEAWGPSSPEWLSLQQGAAFYGVSVDTLRRRISAGKLRASRFGVRLIRVRVDDLDQLFRAIPTGEQRLGGFKSRVARRVAPIPATGHRSNQGSKRL